MVDWRNLLIAGYKEDIPLQVIREYNWALILNIQFLDQTTEHTQLFAHSITLATAIYGWGNWAIQQQCGWSR